MDRPTTTHESRAQFLGVARQFSRPGADPPAPELFVLITPDAVVRRLAGDVVSRVRAAGFEVTRCRIWRTLPRQVERFHARSPRVVADEELQAMARELMDLGPSLALLLHSRRRASVEVLLERLRRLKGHRDPRSASPGTIRHDLRAISTMLNLVHVSADVNEVIRDRETFFDPSEGFDEPDVVTAIAELDRLVPHETRGLATVLDDVRRRVPQIDTFLGPGDAAERGNASAGMALLRAADVELDPWAHLLVHTSMRFSPGSASALVDVDRTAHV